MENGSTSLWKTIERTAVWNICARLGVEYGMKIERNGNKALPLQFLWLVKENEKKKHVFNRVKVLIYIGNEQIRDVVFRSTKAFFVHKENGVTLHSYET